MYHVISWNTREALASFEKLKEAKRYCRSLGHTGEDDPFLTSYPPVAYVTNESGELVYNPRFRKGGKQCAQEL